MSHIVSFEIHGLAGRNEVYKQKLNRDVNIFFGLNGSGKTSLLRILDSAMHCDASRISLVPFTSAKINIYSITLDTTFTRSIKKRKQKRTQADMIIDIEKTYIRDTMHVLQSPYFLEDEFKWKTEPLMTGNKEDTSPYQHVYLPTWRLYGGNEPYSLSMSRIQPDKINREYEWDQFFGKQLEELWKTYTNKLLSNVRIIQEQGLANILCGIIELKPTVRKRKNLDADTVYKHVSDFLNRQSSKKAKSTLGSLTNFKKKFGPEPRFTRAVSDIDQVERDIQTAMSSRYDLERLIGGMFAGNKNIIFKDTGIEVRTPQGNDIGLAALSSGEKHLLNIFIDALLADKNSIMIDEPELSLHIDWQKKLVNSIYKLNSEMQLICATHSPEIMGKIPDKNIFRL